MSRWDKGRVLATQIEDNIITEIPEISMTEKEDTHTFLETPRVGLQSKPPYSVINK